MPANHADTQPLSKRIGATINQASAYGFLTNTNVAAADTLNGLDSAVEVVKNSPAFHADQRYPARQIKEAYRKDAGITDATILSLTTVAGLVALTDQLAGTRTDLLGD